ncbi:acetylglutamate kinase [Streptomyces sp. NPDC101150]|uniref:amino acid kinase family protein n=1 Tax=Streptomyces sp. NPDC101150 TaxID=3366114 RepID=UPI003827A3F1
MRRPDAVVVKVGGSTLDELTSTWWDDISHVARSGLLVLVHGWSKPLARLNPSHGAASAFLRDRHGNRSRLTTPEVLADIRHISTRISRRISTQLGDRGVSVLALDGSDGILHAGHAERWWWVENRLVELANMVGPPLSADLGSLVPSADGPPTALLVTPLARNPAGRVVNTDADRAAAVLANELRATDLVLVTDVPGIRVGGSPAPRLTAAALPSLIRSDARGGARKKLLAAHEALNGGVARVSVGNGPVRDLLLGRCGTVIEK